MADTIRLGDQDFEIVPLTIGHMRKIGVGSAKFARPTTDPAERENNWYDGTLDILAAATGKPRAEFEAMPAIPVEQLIEANAKIFELSKLRTRKVDEPGEAAAGPQATV